MSIHVTTRMEYNFASFGRYCFVCHRCLWSFLSSFVHMRATEILPAVSNGCFLLQHSESKSKQNVQQIIQTNGFRADVLLLTFIYTIAQTHAQADICTLTHRGSESHTLRVWKNEWMNKPANERTSDRACIQTHTRTPWHFSRSTHSLWHLFTVNLRLFTVYILFSSSRMHTAFVSAKVEKRTT